MTITETKKAIWTKRPARDNMNTAREADWTGVDQNKPAQTGTDINTNSQVYSRYITNMPPKRPASNQDAPTTLAEKNRQKPNTNTVQDTTE